MHTPLPRPCASLAKMLVKVSPARSCCAVRHGLAIHFVSPCQHGCRRPSASTVLRVGGMSPHFVRSRNGSRPSLFDPNYLVETAHSVILYDLRQWTSSWASTRVSWRSPGDRISHV